MSFLNTTATLRNTTAIPLPASRKAAAVALLHDHDFYLRCDPHLTKYEPVPTPSDPAPSWESYKIPASVSTATANKVVKLYDVTDHVPNPVYSSNIVSREVLVDWSDGLWVRLHSAMGVVMETTWFVQEDKKGELELVEEVKITCNRMLMGLVRGSVETNWQGIHSKIVERMIADAKKEEGASI